MAINKLFDALTWKIALPAPFDTISNPVSTTFYSKYCTVATKKSTLHSSLLSAILTYMEMDTAVTPASSSECAIGGQGDKIVAEYASRTGELHVVVFNKKNGKFNAGRFHDPDADTIGKVYSLKNGGNTGTALFFTLMPIALEDDEFEEQYNALVKCRDDGYSDMDKAAEAAHILCDNLYRRITSNATLGSAGISVDITSTGNIAQLTALNLQKGTYSPDQVYFGNFRVLTVTKGTASSVFTDKTNFVGKYTISERTLSFQEQNMIPAMEDWYVIPEEVVSICKHAQMTSNGTQPMRNFMLRGPSGTGKTEGAKAIAAGLGRPYMFLTCSANSEIYDFYGQMLPDTNNVIPFPGTEYPSLTDIQMDPSSAYYKLTGDYNEDISEDKVYEKLIEVIQSKAKEENGVKETGQKFRYVDTPLIEAIRKGYVIEIQEPTVIANPGVMVGLNSLLDRCASVTLPTGETIKRHPDTVVVVTTNSGYAGCRDMNQSVISRMNLVIDLEEPDTETLVKRVMNVTGCTDVAAVTEMAEVVKDISEHCRETMINDGCCGVRELISWVQSFMVCGNVMEAATHTVLSSVSSDPDNRADILSSCLEQKFAA